MEHLRKVLLLASVASLIPAQASPAPSLSYQQALSTAIHFYNEVHRGENAFRLLQISSLSPNQGPHEQTLKRLNFTLKETVCPMTEELLLDQCDFKIDGLVKECQGSVSNEQGIAAIILTCDPVAPQGANSFGQLGLDHKENVLESQQLNDFCDSKLIRMLTGGGKSAVVPVSSLWSLTEDQVQSHSRYLELEKAPCSSPSFTDGETEAQRRKELTFNDTRILIIPILFHKLKYFSCPLRFFAEVNFFWVMDLLGLCEAYVYPFSK